MKSFEQKACQMRVWFKMTCYKLFTSHECVTGLFWVRYENKSRLGTIYYY